MEIIGRIKMIGFTQQVSPTFLKREVVITTEEQYPQHILIEFTQEKCDLLNNFQIGHFVKVGINLRGREWTNPQGETRYFNSIQAWKVDTQHQQTRQNYAQPQIAQQGDQTNINYSSATDAYFQSKNYNANPTYGGVQNYNTNTCNQKEMFNGNLDPTSDPDHLPF